MAEVPAERSAALIGTRQGAIHILDASGQPYVWRDGRFVKQLSVVYSMAADARGNVLHFSRPNGGMLFVNGIRVSWFVKKLRVNR